MQPAAVDALVIGDFLVLIEQAKRDYAHQKKEARDG